MDREEAENNKAYIEMLDISWGSYDKEFISYIVRRKQIALFSSLSEIIFGGFPHKVVSLLSVGDENCSRSHRKDAKGAKKTMKTWRSLRLRGEKSPVSPNNTQRGDYLQVKAVLWAKVAGSLNYTLAGFFDRLRNIRNG